VRISLVGYQQGWRKEVGGLLFVAVSGCKTEVVGFGEVGFGLESCQSRSVRIFLGGDDDLFVIFFEEGDDADIVFKGDDVGFREHLQLGHIGFGCE